MAAGNNVMALMFDMNKLWEEYVYTILKRQLLEKDNNYTVLAQSRKDFWTSSDGGKIVKPDIVVNYGDRCVAVLDTKWKCPKDGKPSDARFHYPKGIALDDKGNVYVADTQNMAIRKIGDAGTC